MLMDKIIRELILTPEFEEYYNSVTDKVREKYDYVMYILRTQRVVSTNLYEMRVAVGNNEHRTFLFAIDASNVIECSQVILLNGFLKKDTKQYKAEIEKAKKILKNLED
jgi:hypothetical protein